MSARHKLNAAHLLGSIIIAAVIAALFKSWIVFAIAVAVLLVAGFHDGSIRPTGRR